MSHTVKKSYEAIFLLRCFFHCPNRLSRLIHRKPTQNVSKKHTNDGFSSARYNSDETQLNQVNFYASGVHACILSDLTTRLTNSTSQYLICVKNNSTKKSKLYISNVVYSIQQNVIRSMSHAV